MGKGDGVRARVYSPGRGWFNSGPNIPFNNKWQNIQITFNQGSYTTYLDGKNIGRVDAFIPDPNNNAYRIGRRWDGAEFMQGEIGEVAMFNTVLSDSQVEDLYNKTKSTYLS
jgi:hypothetical protein